MARLLRAAIFIAFIFSAKSALAACHVVTPSGSGSKTGADWNNAYAGLPATLTRGDMYYLADGNYGSYSFTTAASGTTTIEIRKAQSYDNCTSIGWNTATMGSAQAVFPNGVGSFYVNAPYLIVNGNGTQTAPGCGGAPGLTVSGAPPTPSDCGIKFNQLGCTGADMSGACDSIIRLDNNANNYSFKYVEVVGAGNHADDLEVFSTGTGPSTFDHTYMHNAGCVYIQDGGDNRIVSFSYFWGTQITSTSCHGQYEFDGTSNRTEHDNVYRDISGTANWTIYTGSGTVNNWKLYNNVIFNSSPAAGWHPFFSDGILSCISPTVCTNFVLVNNTIINAAPSGNNCGMTTYGVGSYTVENNIWYANSCGLNLGAQGIQDYNSFLNSGTGVNVGAHDLTNASSGNPFVNWPAGNFNIASENANWTSRLALGAPYTVDPNGTTRSTDRGAYQYTGSGAQAPHPPTGLAATVN